MTVSIGNLRATWSNSSIDYIGLGLNVNSTVYGTESSLFRISLNNVEKLKLAANGLFYISGNLISSNVTITGGNTDISYVSNVANSAYNIAVAAFNTANAGGGGVSSLAFDKANSANVLAYNTGIGTNTYLLATIAGANTAVGTGANTYLLATIAGANTAVGTGANTYLLATIAGANTAVGSGANTYLLATIAGANTAVGTGANTYLLATIAGANTAVGTGANTYLLATIAGANTAVGTGANTYLLATIAGANTAVGTGANTYLLATIAGANTAVGTGANTYLLATIAGANTAVGSGANTYLLATIAGANTAVGTGANAFATSAAAGANAYMIAVQNGANTAVGTGANTYLLATLTGANTAVGTGANTYLLATIAGANTAVGSGANTYLLATIAGANTAVGTGANTYLLATIAGANTAVGTGANTYLLATIAGANTAVGSGANTVAIAAFAAANAAGGGTSAAAFDKANSANVLAYNTGIGTNTYLLATIAGANTAVGSGANTISIAAFNKANNALANSTGTFSGNLTITGSLSVGGNNISPVQSFRNKIINGNFNIWQRTTSTSTAGYLADRWQTYVIGSTFTSSRQSFTIGQTSVPYEPTYWHRTVVTSSAGAGNCAFIQQPIESVRTLAGQTATLSFWAKADASKNIAVEFVQYFGTGGSPSSTVTGIGVATCALTTSWTKYTVTVNISSISGKTLGSNNNDYLGVYIWFDAGSTFNSRTNSLGQQSGTFDIAQVQLEAGPVETPFEIRPLQVELALCQRYFQEIGGSGAWNGVIYTRVKNDVNNYYGSIFLPVNMRVAPTISYSLESPSNAIHKPWIRWDTVSTWSFAVYLTNRIDVEVAPATDDGVNSNILFLYGYRIWASAEY